MAARSLTDVNQLDTDAAVKLLGGVFEHSPWIVRDTWPQRPFPSVSALHSALCATVERASEEEQRALIQAHPDLGGEAALRGSLTKDSTAEQRAAGLGADDLAPDEIAAFTRLNAAYRAKLGFPFVICAREHKKAAILEGFATRLEHDSAAELAAARREVERIAWYRLADLVVDVRESATGGSDEP